MKILIISDGKFGDRVQPVIEPVFPDVSTVFIEGRDRSELIDEYEFDPEVEGVIEAADLVLSYITHPDINFELALFGKATIISIYFGKGFLRQVTAENPNVAMPPSMCGLERTGIGEIDEFAKHFGMPRYELCLEEEGATVTIKDIKATCQSPCGATATSLAILKGKAITPETLNAYAINIAQECRESVAYMLSKTDTAETATMNHIVPLLDALEKKRPALFASGSALANYAKEKRTQAELGRRRLS